MGQVLKISAQALGPSATVLAGTPLTTQRLTSIDFVDTGVLSDGESWAPGEPISLRINGTEITSSSPTAYATALNTNRGSITAIAFVVAGDTYLLAQTGSDLAGVTHVVASSVLNGPGQAITGISPRSYGLVPENSGTYTGSSFLQVTNSGQFAGGSVRVLTLRDADGIRGNADSAAEEVITGGFLQPTAREVLATVQLKNGQVVAVNALETVVFLSYAITANADYVFDQAALAAQGASIVDVARVLSTAATDHNLNWADLGFTLQQEGSGNITPDPTSGPPPLNRISGTNAADTITGTAQVDVIRGLGGNDVMRGGAGNDFFVFGNETRNGRRDTDVIQDFEVNRDKILIEGRAALRSITNITGGVRMIFEGDGDRLDVFGPNVRNFNTGVFFASSFPIN